MAEFQGAGEGAPADAERALTARALGWLAQREYSRQELRNKLLRYAAEPGPLRSAGGAACGRAGGADAAAEGTHADRRSAVMRVEAVLDWLESHRHLSHQRFIESRVHSRSGRFGNARIRQELAQHGVAVPAEVDAALRASEFDRARAVWERKFGGAPSRPAHDPAAAARQARFLAGRGFSGEVIRRVLREVNVPATRSVDIDDGPSDGTPGGAGHGEVTSHLDASHRTGATRLRLIGAPGKPTKRD